MRFLFVRHGQSENNKVSLLDQPGSPGRVSDPPLTLSAWQAGQKCAEYIKGILTNDWGLTHDQIQKGDIVRILCSAQLRGLQSAEAVQKVINCPVDVYPELHEQGGLFEGPRSAVGKPSRSPITIEDAESEILAIQNLQENRGAAEPSPVVPLTFPESAGPRGLSRSEISTRWPQFHLGSLCGESGWWHLDRRETEEEFFDRTNRFVESVRGFKFDSTRPTGPSSGGHVSVSGDGKELLTEKGIDLLDNCFKRFNTKCPVVILVGHGQWLDRVLKSQLHCADHSDLEDFPTLFLHHNFGITLVEITVRYHQGLDRLMSACAVNFINNYQYLPEELRHGHALGPNVQTLT